jgi:hypothetical protein
MAITVHTTHTQGSRIINSLTLYGMVSANLDCENHCLFREQFLQKKSNLGLARSMSALTMKVDKSQFVSQVYTEAFSCPCVRYHPYESSFVAQSNGNYIAIFSARPPFKLNKYMRFEGHGVWGFPINCNFSLSGRELVSGSSDGCVYFYDYKSARLLRKIEAFKQPCIDVAYHPVMPNVIASCSWTGEISVFE